tara:strand:+ start:2242 stop:2655 length:414 start_codon:yes stop_codon:yes gene_type:complete
MRVCTVAVLIFLCALYNTARASAAAADLRGQCPVIEKSFLAEKKPERRLSGWQLFLATLLKDIADFLDRINAATENYLDSSTALLQKDMDKAAKKQLESPYNPYRLYGHPTVVKKLNAAAETGTQTGSAPQRRQRAL